MLRFDALELSSSQLASIVHYVFILDLFWFRQVPREFIMSVLEKNMTVDMTVDSTVSSTIRVTRDSIDCK